MDHLESVLVKEAVDKLLRSWVNIDKMPDFVICISDDRSDEEFLPLLPLITVLPPLKPPPEPPPQFLPLPYRKGMELHSI